MLVYVAVYVAFPVTFAISGVHPANVYVYCAVDAFSGSAGTSISLANVPYSYSVLDISVPSSSTNFIV